MAKLGGILISTLLTIAIVVELSQIEAYPSPHEHDECPFACIDVYEPVCGKDGNTHSNSCYLECEGIIYFEIN